ncbi:MAG: hypothetical protein MUQ75_02415 [Crocinitomicaceae bacterium]|nr:hypothetical protein [Crocinitomicaceae bacterium]
MYIPESNNPSNFEEENFNANRAMESGMNWLWENFIEPNVDEANEDQERMLAIIGVAFKVIADQANAYEKLQDLDQEEKNDFSRN